MIQNILFELYEYSYLMNTFHVLENNADNIINIDRIEFWTLVQDDCHREVVTAWFVIPVCEILISFKFSAVLAD